MIPEAVKRIPQRATVEGSAELSYTLKCVVVVCQGYVEI